MRKLVEEKQAKIKSLIKENNELKNKSDEVNTSGNSLPASILTPPPSL